MLETPAVLMVTFFHHSEKFGGKNFFHLGQEELSHMLLNRKDFFHLGQQSSLAMLNFTLALLHHSEKFGGKNFFI